MANNSPQLNKEELNTLGYIIRYFNHYNDDIENESKERITSIMSKLGVEE